MIQPVFDHFGNTAALFLDNPLEVDVSIAEGSIFSILGSEKRSEKPINGMYVCGQTIVETSMYTMVRMILLTIFHPYIFFSKTFPTFGTFFIKILSNKCVQSIGGKNLSAFTY